jgi:hypothetical protein
MSTGQIIFAVITACLGVAGLAWTVTWAVGIWRKAGDDVTIRLARGEVDNEGTLRVRFANGEHILSASLPPERRPATHRTAGQHPNPVFERYSRLAWPDSGLAVVAALDHVVRVVPLVIPQSVAHLPVMPRSIRSRQPSTKSRG